jgi:DNA-binding NarL/FixJ family response regulator
VKPTLKSRFYFFKMEKIKVILSCPQVIFREGIHFILSGEEDFDVIGEATANQEALELIEANPPNIVILSRADVKSDCAEVTRRIKVNYPAVSVVLINDKSESEQLFTAIVSGISAVFTADTDPEQMLVILRDVAQGRLPIVEALFMPFLAARTLTDFHDLATLNERMGITMAQLSKKEVEILNSFVSGSTVGQVAAGLSLSEETLRNHLRTVLQKLAANDRNRAIIEKTQMTLSSLIPGLSKGNGEEPEYLTRVEFNEFKNILMAGFKSLVGEKS